jgi:hypothetical protein
VVRYLVSLLVAGVLVFLTFWIGSQIAILVSQSSDESADFLRGRKLDLCGYQVDSRHALAGYDLEEWKGERCEALSRLDRCVLACLAAADAVEIAAGCYPDCVKR